MSKELHPKTVKRYRDGKIETFSLEELATALKVVEDLVSASEQELSDLRKRVKALQVGKSAKEAEAKERKNREAFDRLSSYAESVGKTVEQLTPKDFAFIFGAKEEASNQGPGSTASAVDPGFRGSAHA